MTTRRKILMGSVLLICLLYMLLEPERTLEGSRQGLLLWFHTVLPTLLPFMILSNLLLHTSILTRILALTAPVSRAVFGLSPWGGYALLLGLFCGYPMGAKLTADLYRERKISVGEARYLLSTANNPSPVFLITYVLHGNLHAENPGRLLLLFYGSFLAAALLLRRGQNRQAEQWTAHLQKKETSQPLPPGVLIDVSIMNGFETVTKLGGYIILCSIGATAIGCLPDALAPVRILAVSVLEISTGIHGIALLACPERTKILLALCAAAFGGFCILMQTYSVIRDTGLPLSSYWKGKVVQTLLTASALLLFV